MSWFKSFWKKRNAPSGAGEKPFTPEPENLRNFTPRAMQVLALARKEAERFNHNFLGTEHLLLGLVKLGQGVSVNVLQKQGVDLSIVRAEVEKQVGINPGPKWTGNVLYTPRTKKVLDLARRETRALNHTYTGTEHILLGLLREGNGVAARVLRGLGVDIQKTREEILKELDPNYIAAGCVPVSSPAAKETGPANSPGPQLTTSQQAQGDPVDVSRRYDVHCADWSQGVTIYRNVRFKGLKHLFQRSPHDVLSGYVELEQENGQTIFVSRSSIIRFNEPGA